MALFGKVTPKRIEGTIFAFMTGTLSFGNTVVSPFTGNLINSMFFHVNKNDLSNYPNLIFVAFIGSLFNFALLFLVPSKKQLKHWRKVRNYQKF